MTPKRLRKRVTRQFSDETDRADIWRAFDLVLPTDAYLNLGYSTWYQPHVLGSSQRRLAARIGTTIAGHLPSAPAGLLLDVGCGRGGPAIRLADQFGCRVVGVDLVPYNVARARENAANRRLDVEFVVGDATKLPLAPESVVACTAIDVLVYLPERDDVFSAMWNVLEPGGVLVFSDLVLRTATDTAGRERVAAFADAWDMSPPDTVAAYEGALRDAGFEVRRVEDLTRHSVGRFRRWTTPLLHLTAGPGGRIVDRLLRRYGLDPSTIEEQVRHAHEALPHVQHVLFVAEK